MKYQRTNTGLIVPSEPPEAVPEHPVRIVIRDFLLKLMEELGRFEQTTHGKLGAFRIHDVADELVAAYEKPDAFRTSELSQVIGGFLKDVQAKGS